MGFKESDFTHLNLNFHSPNFESLKFDPVSCLNYDHVINMINEFDPLVFYPKRCRLLRSGYWIKISYPLEFKIQLFGIFEKEIKSV